MNLPNPNDNELADNIWKALTNSSGSLALTFGAFFYDIFLASIYAHNQVVGYNDEDLQKTTKFALNLFL